MNNLNPSTRRQPTNLELKTKAITQAKPFLIAQILESPIDATQLCHQPQQRTNLAPTSARAPRQVPRFVISAYVPAAVGTSRRIASQPRHHRTASASSRRTHRPPVATLHLQPSSPPLHLAPVPAPPPSRNPRRNSPGSSPPPTMKPVVSAMNAWTWCALPGVIAGE
jgi:hypothetical protein